MCEEKHGQEKTASPTKLHALPLGFSGAHEHFTRRRNLMEQVTHRCCQKHLQGPEGAGSSGQSVTTDVDGCVSHYSTTFFLRVWKFFSPLKLSHRLLWSHICHFPVVQAIVTSHQVTPLGANPLTATRKLTLWPHKIPVWDNTSK